MFHAVFSSELSLIVQNNHMRRKARMFFMFIITFLTHLISAIPTVVVCHRVLAVFTSHHILRLVLTWLVGCHHICYSVFRNGFNISYIIFRMFNNVLITEKLKILGCVAQSLYLIRNRSMKYVFQNYCKLTK